LAARVAKHLDNYAIRAAGYQSCWTTDSEHVDDLVTEMIVKRDKSAGAIRRTITRRT
jgi:hypothetical protein